MNNMNAPLHLWIVHFILWRDVNFSSAHACDEITCCPLHIFLTWSVLCEYRLGQKSKLLYRGL